MKDEPKKEAIGDRRKITEKPEGDFYPLDREVDGLQQRMCITHFRAPGGQIAGKGRRKPEIMENSRNSSLAYIEATAPGNARDRHETSDACNLRRFCGYPTTKRGKFALRFRLKTVESHQTWVQVVEAAQPNKNTTTTNDCQYQSSVCVGHIYVLEPIFCLFVRIFWGIGGQPRALANYSARPFK
ncbi:hypothetical protein B0H12DRAFT_1078686 [Mycena haematopus]|nr:hypothetical protein B0H12DRAFT_1078686 [Mycena haematopus]